jgi:hypothetical protein
MRRIASLALAIAGLTVTALPGLADDQSIGYATGTIGGAPAWAYDQQAQTTWRPYGPVQRTAPSSYGSYAQYNGYPQYNGYARYDDYAQGGGYGQRSCTYSGGPKAATTWTCQ